MGYRTDNDRSTGRARSGYRIDMPDAYITKLITRNGVYIAREEDLKGYTGVDVQVPNTYTAEQDKYVLNVDTLVPQTPLYVNDNGVYDTTFHTPTHVLLPDYETRKWGTRQGPVSIAIESMPDKTVYEVGEVADYRGLKIRLLDGNGNLYTDDYYTDGIVTWESGELSCDVDIVGLEYAKTATSDLFPELESLMPIKLGRSCKFKNNVGWGEYFIEEGATGSFWGHIPSRDYGMVFAKAPTDQPWGNKSVTYFGKTAKYNVSHVLNPLEQVIGVYNDRAMNRTFPEAPIAWVMIYGTLDYGNTVTVTFNDLSDGTQLTTTFDIEAYKEVGSVA